MEDMTTVEIAKAIRKGLKEQFEIKRNHVSVRATSVNMVDVIFKEKIEIDVEAFYKFVRSFESYEIDEMTHEILCGGNTFVHVSTDY